MHFKVFLTKQKALKIDVAVFDAVAWQAWYSLLSLGCVQLRPILCFGDDSRSDGGCGREHHYGGKALS